MRRFTVFKVCNRRNISFSNQFSTKFGDQKIQGGKISFFQISTAADVITVTNSPIEKSPKTGNHYDWMITMIGRILIASVIMDDFQR